MISETQQGEGSCGSIDLQVKQKRNNVYDDLFALMRLQKAESKLQIPLFDVLSIRKDDFIRKNSEFNFFIDLLEGWNHDAAKQDAKFDRGRFELLNFIFFHLKNIALQDEQIKNQNISRLFRWHQHYSHPRPRIIECLQGFKKVRKNVSTEDVAEQIRKTFLSPLPQKIDSFERKVFIPQANKKKKFGFELPKLNSTDWFTERRYSNQQQKMRTLIEDREIEQVINEFNMRKTRCEQTRTCLAQHCFVATKQVRRMPRDDFNKQLYSTIMTSRIQRNSRDTKRGPRTQKLHTEEPERASCIDGLMLLKCPLETSSKKHR